jgi:hypothetical protein
MGQLRKLALLGDYSTRPPSNHLAQVLKADAPNNPTSNPSAYTSRRPTPPQSCAPGSLVALLDLNMGDEPLR